MNNRQSGRRRGRNNNNNRQSSGGRGGMDQANRIDSRARGNGAQMIEKFRNLARDAQLAGDRVQTEYYLQFADHYFRVVSDFRQRQEERNQTHDRPNDRQRELRGVEDFDGHDDTDENDSDDSDNGSDSSDHRSDNRNNRQGRDRQGRDRQQGDDDNNASRQQSRPKRGRNRDDDNHSDERSDTKGNSDEGEDKASPAKAKPAASRSPRRPARAPRPAESEDSTGIDSAALPPAIGRAANGNGKAADEGQSDDAAPAPKIRRPRRTLAKRDEGSEAAE